MRVAIITGAGGRAFSTGADLKEMSAGATIDGYTQAGAASNSNGAGAADNAALRIRINGSSLGVDGLTITGSGDTVRGHHLSDPRSAPEEIRDLRGINFRGALSLELFNPNYWKQDPLTVARTGLQKMRAVVRCSLAKAP